MMVSASLPLILGALHPQFDADGAYILDEKSDFVGAHSKAHGSRVLVLFTNEPLLKQFARRSGTAEYKPIFLDTHDAVIEVCQRCKALLQCGFVVLDPPATTLRVPGIPIDEFIKGVEQSRPS